MADTSLAALLLTNRLVDVGAKPLSSSEFWTLTRTVGDLSLLVGASVESISELSGMPVAAERVASLLSAATAFSFERERLEEEGIQLVSALDEAFPTQLRERLRDACPAFLLVAGPIEFLAVPAIGVVGSRDASEESLSVADAAAREGAGGGGRAVVSGLARGVDQAAMAAAFDAGAPVVGFPAEGLQVVARNAEIRRRVHAGELCMASPYAPSARFVAGNALGRNKLIYGHADITLVVCCDLSSGGTWEGASEAVRRNFGRVAVWMGQGAGLGNAKLVEVGGTAITDLHDLVDLEAATPSPTQTSLFE